MHIFSSASVCVTDRQQQAEDVLQYHVATLIDNQLPGQPQVPARSMEYILYGSVGQLNSLQSLTAVHSVSGFASAVLGCHCLLYFVLC